ncbi:CapA family protein [Paenibacillus senegalensis]|uniref:CapA family protein n=1 Tax=Paenibacillus senegalensis TaxID=1465766 RepID=UPI000288BB68|nr:CapA family protein [Paenibacillus senegalensis]
MNIQLALTGDLLVREPIIQSARLEDKDAYSFHALLAPIVPYLQQADLTIANLEVTLAGREEHYLRRNPANRYPQFNCPDELASALRKAGLHVLTTANNHCLDRGVSGLRRTLRVLDKHGIKHTGTNAKRHPSGGGGPVIVTVKGIRIGILSYTRGTNSIACPYPWMVNRMNLQHIRRDLYALRRKADFCIVALHHGPEYSHIPTQGQRRWARKLMKWGADLVLGSHPHVVQPVVWNSNGKLAVYSLGSLISSRLKKNPHTMAGVILLVQLQQIKDGRVVIKQVKPVPTWVHKSSSGEAKRYQVLPLEDALQDENDAFEPEERKLMEHILDTTLSIIGPRSSL